MWQAWLSFNCDNPLLCADMGGTGGFWGWVEFDRSADGTQTWGDAQSTFCFHTPGGGGAGAGHYVRDQELDDRARVGRAADLLRQRGGDRHFRGMKMTTDFSNMDTGIPAVPGRYNTTDVLGFSAPGVAIQIQVAFQPAK